MKQHQTSGRSSGESSLPETLKTWCLIPFQSRDHPFFDAVYEDGVRLQYKGRLPSLSFSSGGVIGFAHDPVRQIVAPLLSQIEEQQNVMLVIASPCNDGFYLPSPSKRRSTAQSKSNQKTATADPATGLSIDEKGGSGGADDGSSSPSSDDSAVPSLELCGALLRSIFISPSVTHGVLSVVTVAAEDRMMFDELQRCGVKRHEDIECRNVLPATLDEMCGMVLSILFHRLESISADAQSMASQTATIITVQLVGSDGEPAGRVVAVHTSSEHSLLDSLQQCIRQFISTSTLVGRLSHPLWRALNQGWKGDGVGKRLTFSNIHVVAIPKPYASLTYSVRVLRFASRLNDAASFSAPSTSCSSSRPPMMQVWQATTDEEQPATEDSGIGIALPVPTSYSRGEPSRMSSSAEEKLNQLLSGSVELPGSKGRPSTLTSRSSKSLLDGTSMSVAAPRSVESLLPSPAANRQRSHPATAPTTNSSTVRAEDSHDGDLEVVEKEDEVRDTSTQASSRGIHSHVPLSVKSEPHDNSAAACVAASEHQSRRSVSQKSLRIEITRDQDDRGAEPSLNSCSGVRVFSARSEIMGEEAVTVAAAARSVTSSNQRTSAADEEEAEEVQRHPRAVDASTQVSPLRVRPHMKEKEDGSRRKHTGSSSSGTNSGGSFEQSVCSVLNGCASLAFQLHAVKSACSSAGKPSEAGRQQHQDNLSSFLAVVSQHELSVASLVSRVRAVASLELRSPKVLTQIRYAQAASVSDLDSSLAFEAHRCEQLRPLLSIFYHLAVATEHLVQHSRTVASEKWVLCESH